MKTITTTREYDDRGRLVKETVMETLTPDYTAPAVAPPRVCVICASHPNTRLSVPVGGLIGKAPFAVTFDSAATEAGLS